MSETAQKRTPLYDEHVRLGAKIVPFAGWLMPVQYTSIVEEHQAVRNNVGIFDISHMGQLIVEGSGARDWLNTMLTNNIDKLDVGTGQYTFLLNERGGIIDDLIVYRIEEQKFLLVVNAARTDEDFAWLQKHLTAWRLVAQSPKCSDSVIAAQILAESQFKGRASRNYFRRFLAMMSICRREITLSIFRSTEQTFRWRGPVTPEKTALKFSFARAMR